MHLQAVLLFGLFSIFSYGHALVDPDPLFIAINFQQKWDAGVQGKDRNALSQLITKSFSYEDCKSNKLKWGPFLDMLFIDSDHGRVLTARADKRKVIYRVEYSNGLKLEIMIKKSFLGNWEMTRAQHYVC